MVAAWFKHLYDTTGINFSIFYDRFDAITYLTGLWTTFRLSIACVVLSVVIGLVGAWLQRAGWAPARWAVRVYIGLFRNTPPLTQLYFFYFGIGSLMPMVSDGTGGMHPLFDNFQWAVISMSLFAGAFNTEIFRAGIEAVPRATVEAAEALGYTRLKIYIHVVLPLAFRISLPALNNNLVTMVKGTTLAYAIGVPELLTASVTIWTSAINVPEMMNVLMVTFLALVAIIAAILHWCERRLHIPGYNR
jgi:polar amino acid transport system permease protein